MSRRVLRKGKKLGERDDKKTKFTEERKSHYEATNYYEYKGKLGWSDSN
jgi:hypothetical protein